MEKSFQADEEGGVGGLFDIFGAIFPSPPEEGGALCYDGTEQTQCADAVKSCKTTTSHGERRKGGAKKKIFIL